MRQLRQRLAGRAEAAQQRVKRDRPDRLGADEAQPVEALLWFERALCQVGPPVRFARLIAGEDDYRMRNIQR
ncbi:MAG: hypothetical protein ACREFB_05155 [Stellaceae bacterium]